jgi:intraflagellar transport protein 88
MIFSLKAAGSRNGRLGTATILARPTTAVRPVGYSSDATRIFDPLNQAFKKTTVLQAKKEETYE